MKYTDDWRPKTRVRSTAKPKSSLKPVCSEPVRKYEIHIIVEVRGA